jgi:hypothetical protein
VALAAEPQAALSRNGNGNKDGLPAARGLPQSWDEIGAGHLVIAQESLEYGWWEAIVIDRKGDTLTLQYRDYPHLPKFVRHRSGVALMNLRLRPTCPDRLGSQSRTHPLLHQNIWRSVMDSKTARRRALNDELRQNFAGGVAVMTPGIAALGAEAVAQIVKTVAVFVRAPDDCDQLFRLIATRRSN